jgi:hypothetical protein
MRRAVVDLGSIVVKQLPSCISISVLTMPRFKDCTYSYLTPSPRKLEDDRHY